MVSEILNAYWLRGAYPYDNWASDSESYFLLQKLWLDLLSQDDLLAGWVADQEVFQSEDSYIFSVCRGNKRILIYPLPSAAEYMFDFYMRQAVNPAGPEQVTVQLVVCAKLGTVPMTAALELCRAFTMTTVDSSSKVDALYESMFTHVEHLLQYNRDGSLKISSSTG